jgi:hypothetical protein
VTADGLRLRYVIDMAEIPTLQEILDADTDRDGQLSEDERQQYLERIVEAYASGLTARLNGTPLSWEVGYRALTAPAGLPSAEAAPATLRVLMDLAAPFAASLSRVNIVRFTDGNYPGRTGWKEIVVEGDDSVRLLRSTASSTDLSLELRRYPPDIPAPPQDVSAEFAFDRGGTWSLATFARGERPVLTLLVMVAAVVLLVRWRLDWP